LLRLRSAANKRHGRSSFALTWPSWRESTFTVEVLTWRGLTNLLRSLFSATRNATGPRSPGSPNIRLRNGWHRWLATLSTTSMALFSGLVLLYMSATQSFAAHSEACSNPAEVQPILLPLHSPNLNAFAERWVRSIKEECLSKLILFGEASLRRTATEFTKHYHHERNHQGKKNRLLFPVSASLRPRPKSPVIARERLGGLLKFYQHAA
jgi:transposase InsO family protein